MRIGFVTQWFPPEAGTLVAAAIADGLASRGHHVDVVTGFPNYPMGELHEGYPLQRYRRDDRSPAVTVHRAPLYPSHDRSSMKRALNYLTFAAAASCVARRHLPQPDVWLVYSSPATAAVPAFMAALGSATPVNLLIEDLWPDSVTQSGMVVGRMNQAVTKGLSSFCNWTYRHAAGIGVISPSMKAVLVARGVPERKIRYTPNWVDVGLPLDTRPIVDLRRSLGLPNGRLFMYAGNMGELQGLEPLVRAFARVPEAHLALIGAGVARAHLEEVVHRERLHNVSFFNSQPTELIGRYIAASDVQVVSLQDTPLLRATMPSKVQSSLAAGKPVLVHGAGDVADIVSDHRLGRTCRPGDEDGTAQAIAWLAGRPAAELTEIGQRSRAFFEQQFSAAAGLDRLEQFLFAGLGAAGDHEATTAHGMRAGSPLRTSDPAGPATRDMQNEHAVKPTTGYEKDEI